jgi:hypothetical protein
MSIDDRSVIEIPYKLLITVIILLLVVPLVWFGLDTYSRAQVETNVRTECERLITAIKHVWKGEEGTSITVYISFQDAVLSSIEYIKIGDCLGGKHESRVRYKISGEQVKSITIVPNVPVTTVNNESFDCSAGNYVFVLEHRVHEGDHFVLIRLQHEPSELNF